MLIQKVLLRGQEKYFKMDMELLKARFFNIWFLHVIVWGIMLVLIVISENLNITWMIITLLGFTMVCRFWDVHTEEILKEVGE